MNPEKSLESKGYILPSVEAPAFNYEPLSVFGGVIYLAGQLAKEQGRISAPGRAGNEVSETEAARQMELCALQSLARLKDNLGSLSPILRVLHMNAYVACGHEFDGISRLADHASAVFIAAFGDAGRHPRSVLGMSRLPQNAPVMIDARFAMR